VTEKAINENDAPLDGDTEVAVGIREQLHYEASVFKQTLKTNLRRQGQIGWCTEHDVHEALMVAAPDLMYDFKMSRTISFLLFEAITTDTNTGVLKKDWEEL
jgi:hypothetical protein